MGITGTFDQQAVAADPEVQAQHSAGAAPATAKGENRSVLEMLPPESAPAAVDRRLEGRFELNDCARMRILQPLSSNSIKVRVLDVSWGGFKVSVPEMLQPGSIIQVHLRAAIVLGEVRYCVEAESEFHAGVRVEDVFWTRELKTSA